MSETLQYRDSDGILRKVEGCRLTIDKVGRHWLWSDQEKRNLSYRIKSREDCLIAAISSLLFTIQRQNERIAKLQSIVNLAETFAESIRPSEH